MWQIVTGATVIYSLRELTERSQLLRTVLAVVVVGLVISIGYDLSQGLNGDAFDRSRISEMVSCGFTPDWFSVKNAGFSTLPMS